MKKLEQELASTQSAEQDKATAFLTYVISKIARYDDRIRFIGATDEQLVSELKSYSVARDAYKDAGVSCVGFDSALKKIVDEKYHPLIG